MPWKQLGFGTYNQAFVDQVKSVVFKKAHRLDDFLDAPERAVRVYREIHGECAAWFGALLLKKDRKDVDGSWYEGWFSDYFKGVQARDLDIVRVVVDIYRRTRRIVVDATARNNILINRQDRRLRCIDTGFALLLPASPIVTTKRARALSPTSKSAWVDDAKNLADYEKFYEDCAAFFPMTTLVVRGLLLLDYCASNDLLGLVLQEPHYLACFGFNYTPKMYAMRPADLQNHFCEASAFIRQVPKPRPPQSFKNNFSYQYEAAESRPGTSFNECRRNCLALLQQYINQIIRENRPTEILDTLDYLSLGSQTLSKDHNRLLQVSRILLTVKTPDELVSVLKQRLDLTEESQSALTAYDHLLKACLKQATQSQQRRRRASIG